MSYKWDPSRDYRADPLPRARAVRVKCLDCCANDQKAARACTIYSCPLWPWGYAAQAARIAKRRLKRASTTPSGEGKGGAHD